MLRIRWVRGPPSGVAVGEAFDVTLQVSDEGGKSVTRELNDVLRGAEIQLIPWSADSQGGNTVKVVLAEDIKKKAHASLDSSGSAAFKVKLLSTGKNTGMLEYMMEWAQIFDSSFRFIEASIAG